MTLTSVAEFVGIVAGKTFTMMGGTESSAGVIPRAIEHIFDAIEDSTRMQFLIRVSYMEVYNETVIDLLQGDFRLVIQH